MYDGVPFSGKLVKLRLKSNALSYGPIPEPDTEVEQKLEVSVNPPTTEVAGFPPPFMGSGVLTKDTVISQLRRPDGSHHRKKTNNSVSICTSYAACVLSFLSSGYRTLSVASVTWILRSTSGTLAES